MHVGFVLRVAFAPRAARAALAALAVLVIPGAGAPPAVAAEPSPGAPEPAARVRFRAVYLDLDDTALDSGGRVRPDLLEALAAYRACGGRVGVATGRTRQAAARMLETLAPDLPVVLSNGTVILENGEVTTRATLDARTTAAVLEALGSRRDLEDAIEVHTVDGVYANAAGTAKEGSAPGATAFTGTLDDYRARTSGDGPPAVLRVVVRAGTGARRERVTAMLNAAGLSGVIVRAPSADSLEAIRAGADKASAIEAALAAMVSGAGAGADARLSLADVLAFGDAANDASMLARAGAGFVMESHAPEARAGAAGVIGGRDTPALAQAIRRLAIGPACVPAANATGGASESAVNTLRRADDGLWFMDFEGSRSKGTVVEFADFVVLIEVPVADHGAGVTRLEDHPGDGEKVLRTLRRAFPGKPLKYVLSSHWHQHSLSALRPFLDAGVTVVTTAANFDRLRAMLSLDAKAPVPAGVRLVADDRFELRDATNAIVAHRFEQKAYPATPTADYLYFELPKYDALHCGCMYSRYDGPPVEGKALLTSREDDLQRLIVDRKIEVSRLVRLNREPDGTDERLPYARLADVAAHGVRTRELAARYRDLPLAELRASRADLVAAALSGNVPARVFNDLAYECARQNDLPRGLEFATIQALLAPRSANAWDTLAEMYYLGGAEDAARALEKTLRAVDPSFTGGGEAAWKTERDELREAWKSLPPK